MQPGYGQQPAQGYAQQPVAQQYNTGGMPAATPPAQPATGAVKTFLIPAILLGLFVFCGWLVSAFKIDGDAGRIISHTGMATGTAGLGLLMLAGYHRLTEKDKDHPTTVGLGLVICILVLGMVGLGIAMQIR
jgi:hypothetical protein